MRSYQSWENEHIAGRLNAAQARFFQARPYEEFYNLEEDRDEIHNLIADTRHRSRVRAMRRALNRHMLEINDNGFIPEGAAGEGYFESRDRTAYPLRKLMVLGECAARRDPEHLSYFLSNLADENAIVRYWAANGVRGLSDAGASARQTLQQMAETDASLHVRIAAAHALVSTGAPSQGVAVLASILDSDVASPLRLQAVDALTLIGEPARDALPALRNAAAQSAALNERGGGDNTPLASRYLVARLENTYPPSMQIYESMPQIRLPPPAL